VGDPTVQVHDFEPGIKPSGLFWTIPVPSSAMSADPATGRARLHMENVPVPDFHDFFNAISPSPASRPAHVSFDVRWAGGGDSSEIRDDVFGFEGDYIAGPLSIRFLAYDDTRRAVLYTSNPGGQTTIGGGVGIERNGVFFT
jgi:hypothetical protein